MRSRSPNDLAAGGAFVSRLRINDRPRHAVPRRSTGMISDGLVVQGIPSRRSPLRSATACAPTGDLSALPRSVANLGASRTGFRARSEPSHGARDLLARGVGVWRRSQTLAQFPRSAAGPHTRFSSAQAAEPGLLRFRQCDARVRSPETPAHAPADDHRSRCGATLARRFDRHAVNAKGAGRYRLRGAIDTSRAKTVVLKARRRSTETASYVDGPPMTPGTEEGLAALTLGIPRRAAPGTA
jgi:hypothetical protein